MNVLALCGSIRNTSSNFALLRAMQSYFSKDVAWSLFEIKALPYFDPELQFSVEAPTPVQTLRDLAKMADLILISTPEYAHGIPGILKNTLGWLVCEESMQKKVAIVIGAPSGGEFVREYLTETTRTMDLLPAPERTLIVRTARSQIQADGQILDRALAETVKAFVEILKST